MHSKHTNQQPSTHAPHTDNTKHTPQYFKFQTQVRNTQRSTTHNTQTQFTTNKHNFNSQFHFSNSVLKSMRTCHTRNAHTTTVARSTYLIAVDIDILELISKYTNHPQKKHAHNCAHKWHKMYT